MAQVEDILGILQRWENIYLAKGGNSSNITDSITSYIASGSNLIGKVGIDQTTKNTTNRVVSGIDRVLVSSNVGMTVAGSYSTGDYIGTSTTPQSFANAVRDTGVTSLIKSITISDKQSASAVAMELWLFSASFTAPTDNAAWNMTGATGQTCLGVIPLPTTKWYASSASKVYSDDTLNIVIKPSATSLFYALVARGTTPTWASLDLQISLGIEQF